MSPRPLDPDHRAKLIDIAARLIAEDGPAALSTRRLAAEAGTSTMAVYTHFGSMSALVREIVYEGFARLQRLFDLVEPTGDPVADLSLLGRAYRHNAITNRHVYGVMFGGASLAGFALSEEDRQHGRYTLGRVVEYAGRCISAGRFRKEDPALVAHQMWLAVHGTVTLDLGGYLVAPYDADRCFEAQLVSLMVGAGDDLARAGASVAASRERFAGSWWAGVAGARRQAAGPDPGTGRGGRRRPG
jgi:AcrR family transcriptional regulator